jgi:hypothetical protein
MRREDDVHVVGGALPQAARAGREPVPDGVGPDRALNCNVRDRDGTEAGGHPLWRRLIVQDREAQFRPPVEDPRELPVEAGCEAFEGEAFVVDLSGEVVLTAARGVRAGHLQEGERPGEAWADGASRGAETAAGEKHQTCTYDQHAETGHCRFRRAGGRLGSQLRTGASFDAVSRAATPVARAQCPAQDMRDCPLGNRNGDATVEATMRTPAVIIVPAAALLVTGCLGASSTSQTTAVSFLPTRGVIVTVGGPAPGLPAPVPGAIFKLIGGHRTMLVRADGRGRFSFATAPGHYRVVITGHAPTVDGRFIQPLRTSITVGADPKPIRLVISIK